MKLILKYLKKHKILFTINLIAVIAYVLTELGVPTIMATMINEGVGSKDIAIINKYAMILLGVALLGGLGNILLNYTSARIASRVTRDIRNDCFKKAQELSHSEYNQLGVSSMITRVSSDVYQLQLFLQMVLRIGLNSPFMILGSGWLIFKTSQTLTISVLSTIPFILGVIICVAIMTAPMSKIQQKLLDKINRITRENITGVRVIRAFRNDAYETKRFQTENEKYRKVSEKLLTLTARVEPLFFWILNLSVIVTMIIASGLIEKGLMVPGTLVAFFEYQFLTLFSLLMFALVFVMYPRAQVSAQRIEELLNMESDIKNPINGKLEGDRSGTVVFNNVSFSYPDGEASVLDSISFEAHRGETIAFIGSTGSGKSTLINLVVRFFDVTQGRILIDGVDVRDYDLKALRNKIGFIPQKARLFKGTIAGNLRYGKPGASQNDLEESAKLSASKDFIDAKPKQFKDEITEGGSNVSGGQRQRLSIARALIRKPEIYIFDDSFSALDYKTDARIRKNLKSITQDSITMIVAQRISSIVDADKIMVLNEGKCVGYGTHRELIKECEVYQEIARSQFSEKEMALYEKH